MRFIKNFCIKKIIRFTEIFQAFTNIDIYSFVKIIKSSNLNYFLKNIFYASYAKWKIEYKNIDNELSNLHNITYNYWIRGFAAYIYARKNIFLSISFYISLFVNYLNLFIQLLKLKCSNVRIIKNQIIINNENNNCKFNFVTCEIDRRFLENFEYLKDNLNDPICFQNYNIQLTNFNLLNIFGSSKHQILINKTLKYCFIFPFMTKHFMKMFNALYLYDYFEELISNENYFILTKERYSMETRSISVASYKLNKPIYSIDHNKFEALPYDLYSLNLPIKQKSLNISLNKKNIMRMVSKTPKSSKNIIIIQASDICGSTISSYEFNTYKDIIKCLEEIKYKGDVVFKYHPSNIKFFVHLKNQICKNILKNKEDINLEFIHKKNNIEFYSTTCNMVISIDYSTSFLNILRMSIPLIYFNKNFDRHIINGSSKVYDYKKFKMVSERSELLNLMEEFL